MLHRFHTTLPLTTVGIGVDSIPEDIRLSSVLTGRHLAILGNVESLPDETDVNDHKLLELADIFLEFQDNGSALELALHKHAVIEIDAGNVDEAWKTLLTFNLG
jgi:hypothetical protein